MSAPLIRSYKDSDYPQVEEIFFESSTRKNFADANERAEFQQKYLGYYLNKFPELAFVSEREGKILGYVVGAPNSNDEELYRLQSHLKVFEKYFYRYPAHLHINCHSEARGLGVGSKLIERLVEELQALKKSGLHIMTGPDSRNRSFYHKLGFNFEETEQFQGHGILIMGKSLTSSVGDT